jgi:S-adenosylmethionine:tRNA ribosyltransferase-isomerase
MTRIEDYNYHLPQELVAQNPLPQRDASRLLVLERAAGALHHARFRELGHWLGEGDLLVVNDTRVFPARLHGVKESGGQVELLLHHLPAVESEQSAVGSKQKKQNSPNLLTAHCPEKLSVTGGQWPVKSEAGPSVTPSPPKGERVGVRGDKAFPNLRLDRSSLECCSQITSVARATHRGRLRPGQKLRFGPDLQAEILALPEPGVAEVRFSGAGDVLAQVLAQGEVPLPPYIQRPAGRKDRDSYQTVFARNPGAVACPTAGLHFTEAVVKDLARRGVETVGRGTFLPVRNSDYSQHRMLPEYFELSAAAAARLSEAKARGQRIVAVGTTSTRVLEHCAVPGGFQPQKGWCDLFIYPGYRFKAVDRLLTNFHLPKSTLLLLVSAFAGRELILRAYAEAVQEQYRFYSYGDCMLIL